MSELTRDDLLVLLIEECAEVIQAATKCQRFGFFWNEPGYGRNDLVLSSEVGDLLGVIDELHMRNQLDPSSMQNNRTQKIAKAERMKRIRSKQESVA